MLKQTVPHSSGHVPVSGPSLQTPGEPRSLCTSKTALLPTWPCSQGSILLSAGPYLRLLEGRREPLGQTWSVPLVSRTQLTCVCVCVCVCACACVCMCVHVHVGKCMHMGICCACLCVPERESACAQVLAHVRVCVCEKMGVQRCTHIGLCMCVCGDACKWAFTCACV